MKKKAIFFSMDAFIALLIIFFVILIAFPTIKEIKVDSNIHRDIIVTLSSLKMGEIQSPLSQAIINSMDTDKTVLEQIGNYYLLDPSLAEELANSALSSIETNKNLGLWFGDTLIWSKNKTPISNAENIEIARQSISGIVNGTNVTGFSARAFLTSSLKSKYFYFGGYIGDGNISANISYEGTIDSAKVELAINNDFDLYINDIPSGSYTKSPSDLTPITYNINETYLPNFNPGHNLLEFKGEDLHIAGGFVKITHKSNVTFNQSKRYHFPGINGLINIYDGLYIPNSLNSMDINLDLESNFTTFLNLGNKTVFNGTTNGRQTITITNSELQSILGNYDSLINKTLPIRLGLRNVSLLLDTKGIDVFSVTDLSGSMDDNCPGGNANPGETPCKINDAKNATELLKDIILQNVENRVGLAGFEDFALRSDFHTLSNDSTSISNTIQNSWDASGYTCVCCGILKAISCYDSNIFSDNFNGQNPGTNPIGWTVSEGNGAIDITSNSIEGDRSLQISRLSSSNPYTYHRFNPQQDELSIEFLINHSSGSGRVRMEIEGVGSSGTGAYDYIRLRMYNGQIRNNYNVITTYNQNQVYKIKIQLTPGSNSYDLYVDDILEGNDLSVYSTRNNVARVIFKTESSTTSYTIDDIKVKLTEELCQDNNNTERPRSMVIMSDGAANRACGLDPVPDWDSDGDITDDPHDHAIQASCDAFNKYGIISHSVAFDVNPGSSAENTLQQIATCGGGNFYSSNVTQLTQIYQDIANLILATFSEQTLNSTGNFNTKLYPGSYINLDYQSPPPPFGLLLTNEKQFDSPTSGSFEKPSGTSIVDTSVISYSGSLWTSNLFVNSLNIYNLSNYGSAFTELGDPYSLKVPNYLINEGNNTINLNLASSPNNISDGSISNKIIYTLSKNVTRFSPISFSANGCTWNIEFEDLTTTTINIPSNYSGSSNCYYHSNPPVGNSFFNPLNSNDAIQIATFNVLQELDLNLNQKIDIKFTQQDLQISASEIMGIPFTWSTEVQARIWD